MSGFSKHQDTPLTSLEWSQVKRGVWLLSDSVVVRVAKVRPDYWTLEWPLPYPSAKEHRRVRMPIQRLAHYIKENRLQPYSAPPEWFRELSSDAANPSVKKRRAKITNDGSLQISAGLKI